MEHDPSGAEVFKRIMFERKTEELTAKQISESYRADAIQGLEKHTYWNCFCEMFSPCTFGLDKSGSPESFSSFPTEPMFRSIQEKTGLDLTAFMNDLLPFVKEANQPKAQSSGKSVQFDTTTNAAHENPDPPDQTPDQKDKDCSDEKNETSSHEGGNTEAPSKNQDNQANLIDLSNLSDDLRSQILSDIKKQEQRREISIGSKQTLTTSTAGLAQESPTPSTPVEEHEIRFAFNPVGTVFPYRAMSGFAELQNTIQAGVRFIRLIIDSRIMNPLKFHILLTGHMWREVDNIRTELLKIFPELEDSENPLEARIIRCPGKVGKAALKKVKAEILFDNQFDSVSAWGAGGILFHHGPIPADTSNWCRFRQVKILCSDWDDHTVAQSAIDEFKLIQSAPIEAALRQDRVLIPRIKAESMTLLLNTISMGPISKANGPEGVVKIMMARVTTNLRQHTRVNNQEKEWRNLVDKWIKTRGEAHPCLMSLDAHPTEAVIIEAITLIVILQAPDCDFSEEVPTCEFHQMTGRFCGGCKYCIDRLGTRDQLQDLKDHTLQVRSPYRSSENSALILVKKMELTLSPPLDINVNEDEPLWELVTLRNGIPKEIHEQLVEKIDKVHDLVENGGHVSNIIKGSNLKGMILSPNFRDISPPSALLIYSFMGYAHEQYTRTGFCGKEDCRRLQCPFCRPRLNLAICIETYFDSATISLAQVNSRTPGQTPASYFSDNDIRAGEVILNGVAGSMVLNFLERNFRPMNMSWNILYENLRLSWETHVNASSFPMQFGGPFLTCLATGKEEAMGFMSWTDTPSEKTTVRFGVVAGDGYFTTTPPILGRLVQPVSCWVTRVELSETQKLCLEAYADGNFGQNTKGESLKYHLLSEGIITPVLVGCENPYWFLDATVVTFFGMACAFMNDYGWHNLRSEGMPEHVFELVVPQAWTLELPNGVLIRNLRGELECEHGTEVVEDPCTTTK